jgi:hypothetical protein
MKGVSAYRQPTDETEILDSIGQLISGSMGSYRLTARKVRLYLERQGVEVNGQRIRWLLHRLAKERGWQKVPNRYYRSERGSAYAYVVRPPRWEE